MKVLLTAGPTHEPIDAVRYIGNRSSGRMGAAIAQAAVDAGHAVTLIAGPISIAMPKLDRRIDVQTAAEMHAAVLSEFANHDLLIMAAAVADFRPIHVSEEKLSRSAGLTIECEPTEDILVSVSKIRTARHRTVGFSLETTGGIERARKKLAAKNLDLIVFNPTQTMNSADVAATLLWPNGRSEGLPPQSKPQFAATLIARCQSLFPDQPRT
jgi:phosphopantothenoylcysteine decarboxylase/phosphopantothenate--cysteine ligase